MYHTGTLSSFIYLNTKPKRLISSSTFTFRHVFYRECLNISTLLKLFSQGKSTNAFISISSQQKEAARTLKFAGQLLMRSAGTLMCICLWLGEIFFVIRHQKLKRHPRWVFVFLSIPYLFQLQSHKSEFGWGAAAFSRKSNHSWRRRHKCQTQTHFPSQMKREVKLSQTTKQRW